MRAVLSSSAPARKTSPRPKPQTLTLLPQPEMTHMPTHRLHTRVEPLISFAARRAPVLLALADHMEEDMGHRTAMEEGAHMEALLGMVAIVMMGANNAPMSGPADMEVC